jgi:hypothetical protein
MPVKGEAAEYSLEVVKHAKDNKGLSWQYKYWCLEVCSLVQSGLLFSIVAWHSSWLTAGGHHVGNLMAIIIVILLPGWQRKI